ncbi:MAG TPA: DUF3858 domain-containing protein [Terriglobales bacterium]|nr:DUF3858 domain-containing protein [Terriglobales bacterium]
MRAPRPSRFRAGGRAARPAGRRLRGGLAARGFWSVGALVLALALAAAAAAPAGSLLDRLPRPTPAEWRAAVARAQARGAAGQADAAWIEVFYGDAAAHRAARRTLQELAVRAPNDAEAVFAQFVLDKLEGRQREEMRAALKLLALIPNDPAAELAARELSGVLDGEGRELLDAAPELRQVTARPLADPTTAYMLGRPLLALVRAPGVPLTLEEAIALAGRPERWTLYGPMGRWRNLDFDRAFAIERSAAASYNDDGRAITGRPFLAVRGLVDFPEDWRNRGIDYAVTYVRVPRREAYALRIYSPASAAIFINGRAVVRNDRRSSYVPATATAAVELDAGWNRLVVKLGGYAARSFSLMLRPVSAAPPSPLASAAALPPGQRLAGAPRLLPPPLTLGAWSAARLRAHPDDLVALWADGVWRGEDEDGETARVELERATKLAPEAVPAWLALTDVYSNLDDASQTWASAQTSAAAHAAERIDPAVLPAIEHLGEVEDSQGQFTAAARDFQRCAGRGYAPCDWAEFHLAAGRHWTPEARQALAHALAASPSDWAGLADGLEFYTDLGDQEQARQLTSELLRDPRGHAALARFFLHHGRAADAASLLAAEVELDPSSGPLRRDYLEALLEARRLDAAQAAARQALADFPDDAQVAAAAADIALAADQQAGLAVLRRVEFGRNALRHEADFLAGDRFWAPWYHSAAEVLKDAPNGAEYPNAASILVLDQMVDRINPDHTRDSYIHQIIRVLNSTGIETQGTVQIPAGSDIITLRTIKPDGTALLPEIHANLNSVQMPGLEPGDFIETEYVMHQPASNAVPGTIDNNMFFVFNSSREPYHYSDYIVLTPNDDPLMIETERFPYPAKVTKLTGAMAGWTAREWLIQKTRILGVEPNMPPEPQLVPMVWVSSKMTWKDISDYLADAMFPVERYTAEMRQTARQLSAAAGKADPVAQARKIFDWVAANITPGEGAPLAPARQYFTDRSGSRLATFLGLLAAAGIHPQLAMARPFTDHSALEIPNFASFQYPLVKVGMGEQAAWFDLNNDFARSDYINPAFRGGQALLAGAPNEGAVFTTVPNQPSPLDGMATTADIRVQPSGDGQLHLVLEFRGPLGEKIRQSLASIPASQLPQVYQQVLLQSYPNATADNGQIQGLEAHDQPLVISVDGTIPGFVRREGDSWEIDHLIGSVGLLSRYASLPARIHPLVIPGDSFETTQVKVTLAAPFAAPAVPGGADISNPFGSYKATYQVTGNELDLSRAVYLKANYITPDQYANFRRFGEVVDSRDHLPVTGPIH